MKNLSLYIVEKFKINKDIQNIDYPKYLFVVPYDESVEDELDNDFSDGVILSNDDRNNFGYILSFEEAKKYIRKLHTQVYLIPDIYNDNLKKFEKDYIEGDILEGDLKIFKIKK